MNGKLELQLEAVPGVLKAAWVPLSGRPALSLKVPLWSLSTRQEIVRRLASCPNEVYDLLQGRVPLWFTGLELLPHGENSGIKDEDMLNTLREGLAEQPILALKLRGFSKEELLEAVFSRWAEAADKAAPNGSRTNPSSGLSEELARLERKGPGVLSGEWLAEAAAEGSLHQPGPLFQEVCDRPFPSNPVVAVAAENWQTLLPQTPKVQEGLSLIMRRVAEAAARRAHDNKT